VNSIKSSIIIGLLSGCILGFLGGNLLKFLGITGYVYSNLHRLQFSIGALNIDFPLQKELGYRLLKVSTTPVGVYVYLLFSIFVIGLGEEIFWRGFIQKKISDYSSMDAAIWLTAVLFAAIHFYIFAVIPINAGICFLVLIAISGVCWGYLFKYFNNVWSAAISHGSAAFIIWKYYFFKP
jgi:membrane protease YdiL (CAAX protease family)